MANLALFDFDGTITREDTFAPFLYFAVEPKRLARGKLLLSPYILAYKFKFLPATQMRARVAKFGFQGRRVDELIEFGERYAAEHLPSVIRNEAAEKIAWHKSQGDKVVVVSASLDLYLKPWCRQMGIDLICTELSTQGGLVIGDYVEGDCSGKEKLRRVGQKYDLKAFPLIYAYGDTPEDFEMLSVAHRKYFCWKEVQTLER